jgi:octaprenyl-diphosphate synthase
MDALQQIRSAIETEMSDFIQTWNQCMHSDNALLQEVLTHVSSRSGKMMRPMLTLLSAKLCGDVCQDTLYSAVALELMHTATLIHDDVVDESEERRGLTSVNKTYDNKIAVLVGDFILALSIENVSKVTNNRFSSIVAATTQELASGELLQLKSVHNQEISEEVYFRIIHQKTASLFAACAQAGAVSATNDENLIQRLSKFGETLGLCFQIRDDIFDYSQSAEIGKPTGNDMKEGKLTLPAIFVLKSYNNAEMLRIAKAVKNLSATESEINQLIDYTLQNGGIEYAEKRMFQLADEAKDLLSVFPDSTVKSALLSYVDYVARRTL